MAKKFANPLEVEYSVVMRFGALGLALLRSASKDCILGIPVAASLNGIFTLDQLSS